VGDIIIPLGPQYQITKHLNLAVLAKGAKKICRCFEFEALKVELDPQCVGDLIIPWGPQFQITKHLNLSILAEGTKTICGCFEFEVLKVELDPQQAGDIIILLGLQFQITKHLNLAVLAQGAKFVALTVARVGQFVALTVEQAEVHVGVLFYMGKVVEFGQRKWVEKMIVVWYWPSMRVRVQTESDCSRTWYRNYMEASWEPSLERHGWVVKEATIYSWEDVPARTRSGLIHENNVQVHGVVTETKIKISTYAKPHLYLVEYIALQIEAMDDE
jgi:hypothetical protein